MDALQAGITAAQAGRQAEAQALLRQALEADPRSEQGWLWMSAVVESDVERRTCLERVLDINPYNQTAQAGLDSLSSD
jgi:Tfp pilus assembly protein PilF